MTPFWKPEIFHYGGHSTTTRTAPIKFRPAMRTLPYLVFNFSRACWWLHFPVEPGQRRLVQLTFFPISDAHLVTCIMVKTTDHPFPNDHNTSNWSPHKDARTHTLVSVGVRTSAASS